MSSCQLIFGPMFSGKTTKLMSKCRTYAISGKECVIVRPLIDTRVTGKSVIFTHAKGSETVDFHVEMVGIDQSSLPSTYKYDVIGIDEGQFMCNLDSIVKDLLKRNKIVIIAALNGKYDTTSWEPVSNTIPFCNEIKLLKSICSICGIWRATTTKLKDEHANNPNLIGGEEKYIALCVSCRFGSK